MTRIAWLALLALLCLVFVGLAVWQVERRARKHALIAQVEQRVHAAPVDAPDPATWPRIDAADAAYRHVAVHGTWLRDRNTFVRAVTALGGGYWVVTPLRRADGSVVLVDRGFVTSDARPQVDRVALDARPTTVTGLLRPSETGGGFMTTNDPAAGRWVSRDVQAIATARGLTRVAPFFIDADSGPGADDGGLGAASLGVPVGGLTVVTFADNHLLYAVIWSLLALLSAAAMRRVLRDRRIERDPSGEASSGRGA